MLKEKVWNGQNKAWVRELKIAAIAAAKDLGVLPTDPCMVSFPGAYAKTERELVRRKLVRPEDIIGIQTYDKKEGGQLAKECLDQLILTRDNVLPEMYIWPHSFHSFTECYTGEASRTPTWVGPEHNRPEWLKNEAYLQEISFFANMPAQEFEIIDVDICGVFGQQIAQDITRLFYNFKFGDSGLFFFTCQKGRDIKGGILPTFLHDYFTNTDVPFYEFKDLVKNWKILEDTEHAREMIRYRLIPLYFICQARRFGYHLAIDQLVEYRDLGETNRGNYMFQWLFNFNYDFNVSEQRKKHKFNKAISAAIDGKYPRRRLEDVAVKAAPGIAGLVQKI